MDMGLKKIREAKGLSQEQVARQIDMSLRQYCRYDSGQIIPKLKTAQKLSIVLDVPMEEILTASTN